MGKQAHTPGPWALTAEGLGFSVRSAGTKENGYSSEHICSMDHYRDDRKEAQVPNARLIAAAPEMLTLVKLVHESFGGGPVVTFSEADIAKFAAVYAKATGDAQ